MLASERFSDDARALLESLTFPGMDSEGVALATEAARIKTRLDALNRVLTGEDEVLIRFVDSGDTEVVLRVDSVLSEARQLATVFRQTVEAVRRSWPDANDGVGEADDLEGLE